MYFCPRVPRPRLYWIDLVIVTSPQCQVVYLLRTASLRFRLKIICIYLSFFFFSFSCFLLGSISRSGTGSLDSLSSIVVNSSRSRTRLSHFSRGIWEIHAEYTCFLRLQLLAKIGFIPQSKGKNPRGLYEISFPLTRMRCLEPVL